MRAPIIEPLSPIGYLAYGPAVTVPAGISLEEAALTMRKANVSSLLVGPQRHIATERDLTRALAAGLRPEEPIGTVASQPICVSANTSVVDAAALMLNQEIRHLVIDGCADGPAVVSLRAVMAVLLQAVTPHIWLDRLRVAVSARPGTWLG
jgi:signal-transduction protein with cAMP-binding, CBS, and nucleotidyltransferase domain